MKHNLLTVALILSAAFSVFGQAGTAKKSKPKVKAIARDKFDPKRDPKPDLEKAIEKATQSGKRIILDVGGEWCGWCVYMDKFFGRNPKIRRLRDDNFVWVKVNYSEENENTAFLSAYPAIDGYPHLLILDETGKLLHSHDTSDLEKGEGYDLAKFTAFLKLWAPKKDVVLPKTGPTTGRLFPHFRPDLVSVSFF